MSSILQSNFADTSQQQAQNVSPLSSNQKQFKDSLAKQHQDQSRIHPPNISQNQKWQKLIEDTQKQDQSTPFLIQPESFKSSNPPEDLIRQKLMMEQTAKKGRQLLIDKNYLQASKQLSKTLMAFQFIAKNHALTIPKEVIREMMVVTVLPAYNNLALCYLKLKNYQLVISFTNQVLAQDESNVKARYRRALASKELKNTDEAIKDFQIAKKLDPQMTNDCNQRIKQCKFLQIQIKKKRKEAAKKFISGYQSDDIKLKQNGSSSTQTEPKQLKTDERKGYGATIFSWIREQCSNLTKLFTKTGPHHLIDKKKD